MLFILCNGIFFSPSHTHTRFLLFLSYFCRCLSVDVCKLAHLNLFYLSLSITLFLSSLYLSLSVFSLYLYQSLARWFALSPFHKITFICFSIFIPTFFFAWRPSTKLNYFVKMFMLYLFPSISIKYFGASVYQCLFDPFHFVCNKRNLSINSPGIEMNTCTKGVKRKINVSFISFKV